MHFKRLIILRLTVDKLIYINLIIEILICLQTISTKTVPYS